MLEPSPKKDRSKDSHKHNHKQPYISLENHLFAYQSPHWSFLLYPRVGCLSVSTKILIRVLVRTSFLPGPIQNIYVSMVHQEIFPHIWSIQKFSSIWSTWNLFITFGSFRKQQKSNKKGRKRVRPM